jgi:membrane protein
VKERLIAIMLVLMSLLPLTCASVLVAFGDQFENWMIFHSAHAFGPYILFFWTSVRWVIAALTSIAVIAVIYHFAVPRTQPWHTVLPGATLATAIWFPATLLFGWYLTHVADYRAIDGPIGVALALLVWMYIVSLVVLFGAEVNALLYPRGTGGNKARRRTGD